MTNDLFAPNENERRLASQAATPVAIDWAKDFAVFCRINIFVFYIVETDSFMGNPDSEEVQDNWGWHVYSRNVSAPFKGHWHDPLAHESGPFSTKDKAINYLIDKGAILL